MECEGDLMAFASPTKLELPEQRRKSSSPGSNPFDTMLRVASDTTQGPSLSQTNILDIAFTEDNTIKFVLDTVPSLDVDDCGRESLGILHINFDELNEDNPPPRKQDLLWINSPFKPSYGSFLTSISSQGSVPSTIYSLQPSVLRSGSLDVFNLGMSPTLIEKHLRTANSVILSPRRANSVSCLERRHFEAARKRLGSVPTRVVDRESRLVLHEVDSCSDMLWKSEADEDSLDDLVFIEASHIASKIADGSILEESPECNLLDSTPQPDFQEIDAIPDEPRCDTETVFKMLDKMLPATTATPPPPDQSSGSSGSEAQKTNSSQQSAKDAIQNLAELLNSETLNERRKAKGQTLLAGLAGILCAEHSPNDSGHSSIELEDCSGALDLRKRSSGSETEQVQALDLSVSCKRGKRASISLRECDREASQVGMVRRASESSLPSSKESGRNESNRTGSSGSSMLSGPVGGKLKLRKASAVKVGPVKAIAAGLPFAPAEEAGGAARAKKTSTPVQKSKIKPIAQSTPEESRVRTPTDFQKKKVEYPVSPLSRPNKLDLISQSKSGSDPSLSSKEKPRIARSNSVVGAQKPSLLSMRRSISAGKGVGLKSAKETVKESGIGKRLGENVLNRSLVSRPFSLLAKFKKGAGKENANH